MVFDKSIPETYEGYKVVDGDNSDLRHYDDWGVIVGLKFKLPHGINYSQQEKLAFCIA
jgi:hypothetical protein